MRWYWLIPAAAGMLASALALPLDPRDVPTTGPVPLARRLEVARLQAHFDSVDAELAPPKRSN
jgi:hypothetical protein